MGTDIHASAEWRHDGVWRVIPDLRPFDRRDYGLFGFLANVRNHSAIPSLSNPRGIPADSPSIDELSSADYHDSSWLSVTEMLAFNYDRAVEDRRVVVLLPSGIRDGAGTAAVGQGRMTTFRALLGPAFFADLDTLRASGAERVVFAFDS